MRTIKLCCLLLVCFRKTASDACCPNNGTCNGALCCRLSTRSSLHFRLPILHRLRRSWRLSSAVSHRLLCRDPRDHFPNRSPGAIYKNYAQGQDLCLGPHQFFQCGYRLSEIDPCAEKRPKEVLLLQDDPCPHYQDSSAHHARSPVPVVVAIHLRADDRITIDLFSWSSCDSGDRSSWDCSLRCEFWRSRTRTDCDDVSRSCCSSSSQQVERRQLQQSSQERMRKRCV